MISYDFPLNERMRTLLRLEDLYAKLLCFIERSSAIDHHAALSVLFEVLEVASRSDLKSDLLQELERQKRQLSALHNNPEISELALDAVLDEIEIASSGVLNMSGKVGQHLRENEWLMGIKQRAGIPGGTCEFDLPSYHHWLHQDALLRRNYLKTWLTPMLPIRDGLALILKLLRESGKAYHYIAQQGNFQQMQCGRVAQMLRVSLDKTLPCVPEVGANKYMLNIRFIAADYVAKSALYDQDVAFNLTFCSL
ncbi:cell division protein ZapD [Candidatus Nitrotoga sp. AM1P]|uniref:cell division protein ZapD n=1 Tax=Candidatus Nitrotoga sp. AM1P TaxID=2559597 RepID=UPI0010B66FDF|nr:cell division protein ZapD [Candidatus Nitrotoga sp. AM1P]BBJ23698.1 cell division protein ZapD [Candidatus Nitrotoga sp. AM1P]